MDICHYTFMYVLTEQSRDQIEVDNVLRGNSTVIDKPYLIVETDMGKLSSDLFPQSHFQLLKD